MNQPITFVTGNAGKLRAAAEHVAPLGIVVEQAVLELDEIQSIDVAQVAMHKATQAFRILRRPLFIEDSGFGINELGGYPGPMIKHLLSAVGPAGIAHLADLTERRECRFTSCLVYIDAHGIPRVFTDRGTICHIAHEPATADDDRAWSPLWTVGIPEGGSAPLSALTPYEREREAARWKERSAFRQFGDWYTARTRPTELESDGRLRSKSLTFDFPPERIAHRPSPTGEDRLLVLHRDGGPVEDRRFDDLPALLPLRSMLVVNNSAVVRAALRRLPEDGTYLHVTSPHCRELTGVECLCPWKPTVGTSLRVRGGWVHITGAPEPGRDLRICVIVPDDAGIKDLHQFMEQHGEVPIPIYVNAVRDPDQADVFDYQNVYASVPGSVACATAGLHLSEARIKSLREAGHDVVEVTCHIGYGTWKSLATEYVDEHDMDAETCAISTEALVALRAAWHEQRPIVAVGTSSVRTLETFADAITGGGEAGPLQTATTLYIAPGYQFRVVDHMITNFAYPQTPIMAMTAAFVGSFDRLRNAYQHAVDDSRYQFLTYGDAMFLH